MSWSFKTGVWNWLLDLSNIWFYNFFPIFLGIDQFFFFFDRFSTILSKIVFAFGREICIMNRHNDWIGFFFFFFFFSLFFSWFSPIFLLKIFSLFCLLCQFLDDTWRRRKRLPWRWYNFIWAKCNTTFLYMCVCVCVCVYISSCHLCLSCKWSPWYVILSWGKSIICHSSFRLEHISLAFSNDNAVLLIRCLAIKLEEHIFLMFFLYPLVCDLLKSKIIVHKPGRKTVHFQFASSKCWLYVRNILDRNILLAFICLNLNWKPKECLPKI